MSRPLKKILAAVATVIVSIYIFNYVAVSATIRAAVAADERNNGIVFSGNYRNYVDLNILVVSLEKVSSHNSNMDVFRALLQVAESFQDRDFEKIVVQFKGVDKFQLKGRYFQKLGSDYEYQNPMYTLRTFPENLYGVDGHRLYGSWSGGAIGVLGKQMEDLNDVFKRWFLYDLGR